MATDSSKKWWYTLMTKIWRRRHSCWLPTWCHAVSWPAPLVPHLQYERNEAINQFIAYEGPLQRVPLCSPHKPHSTHMWGGMVLSRGDGNLINWTTNFWYDHSFLLHNLSHLYPVLNLFLPGIRVVFMCNFMVIKIRIFKLWKVFSKWKPLFHLTCLVRLEWTISAASFCSILVSALPKIYSVIDNLRAEEQCSFWQSPTLTWMDHQFGKGGCWLSESLKISQKSSVSIREHGSIQACIPARNFFLPHLMTVLGCYGEEIPIGFMTIGKMWRTILLNGDNRKVFTEYMEAVFIWRSFHSLQLRIFLKEEIFLTLSMQ